MFAYSFRPNMSGNFFQLWQPSLNQYLKLVSTASYWRLLWTSAQMALVISVSAVVLSYPVSYFLAFHAGRRAGFYLVLLLVPFWTSYLLRVMAWKIMLGTEGVINSFLIYAGWIREPLTALLYNRGAVVLTLVYVWIPFAALPILAALQRIDVSLFEAAADLGARPLRQFVRIALPLSLPGVFAAFFMVFIPTVGEYVTPLLVGGSRGSMYGNIIQDFGVDAPGAVEPETLDFRGSEHKRPVVHKQLVMRRAGCEPEIVVARRAGHKHGGLRTTGSNGGRLHGMARLLFGPRDQQPNVFRRQDCLQRRRGGKGVA